MNTPGNTQGNTPGPPRETPSGPENTPAETGNSPSEPKLLDQVRDQIRLRHYSIRTEAQYVHWVKRYILFHHKRHPREMGATELEAFLTHLAVDEQVASATQNQALSALLFLYRKVLGVELPWLDDVVRAKRSQRLPVVLTRGEVQRVLERMDGVYGLLACLLYGTGMRLMEVICASTCSSGSCSSRMICGSARRASICRTRWSESTRGQAHPGPGSICLLREVTRSIRAAALKGVIIWTKSCCSAR